MRRSRAAIMAPLVVAAATFVVFSGALRDGFVNWDDDMNILANPHYRGLGLANLRWMFVSPTVATYEPLVWLSFAATYLLSGESSFAYHLSGVLMHALTAAVLYGVTVCLLRAAEPDGKNASETALRWSAALAALLFALHPLRVEVVAWLSGRHHMQGSLFLLLSVWAYLKGRERGCAPGARRRWLAAALFSCVLSLLSSPVGVTLPVVLLILDAYLHRRPEEGSGAFDPRASLREKLPFILLAAAAALATLRSRAAVPGGLLPLARHGVGDRLSEALFGLAFYAWKTLAPVRLSPFYPLPKTISILAQPFLLSGCFVAAATAAAFALRRRWPSVIAVWAYYVVALSPVLGLAQYGTQIAADRYTYLPSLGLAVLTAGALTRLWTKRGALAWSAAAAAAAAALVALSALSWRQVKIWRDSETLWSHVLSLDPHNAIAQYDLGLALAGQGETYAAISHYNLALQEQPDLVEARNSLGVALAGQGRLDEAIRQYELALRERPDFSYVHYDLGLALAAQGKTEDAIRQYELALKAQPDFAQAHNTLALILAGRGKTEEAILQYNLALQAKPDFAEAHNNLGAALAGQGKLDEAIGHFQEAVRLNPGYAAARGNLATALGQFGRNR